ncbi:hypothetical protein JZ751_026251 [Albula glossodonta]|uniref:Uncharacterized protein n=1 Tax=Albula glossodonta TaxID=121402 RepID=A0A8T2PK44_9TELE|nr:hypothetical protein JZ751_026251 [Albula glossodonta]
MYATFHVCTETSATLPWHVGKEGARLQHVSAVQPEEGDFWSPPQLMSDEEMSSVLCPPTRLSPPDGLPELPPPRPRPPPPRCPCDH